MKTFQKALFVIGLVLVAAGCAPDEKELCSHLMELYADKPNDRPRYLEEMDSCVDYYEGIQKRHGINSYRREAECIHGVDTVYNVKRCIKKEDRRRFKE